MRIHPVLAVMIALPALVAAGPVTPRYAVSGSVAGPDGAWDYAQFDSASHRLYVARADSVMVLDADGKVTSWGVIARGHAVLPLPDNRLLVTSGNDATVRFFNTRDGSQMSSIAVGKKPDAAIYDPAHGRALVMNADSGTVSVIDIAGMKVVKTITVKPALEFAALDKRGTLFVNNEDANEVDMIDPAGTTTPVVIAMPGCEGPTGLGYDAKYDRLISACANGKAAIIDARAHKLLALVDIGRGADAVIMDEQRGLAFIPCGKDGILDILSLASPAGVTKVGSVTTEVGARTGAIDPATGTVYLPSAKFGPPAPGAKRPTMIPGSFHVLVIKPI